MASFLKTGALIMGPVLSNSPAPMQPHRCPKVIEQTFPYLEEASMIAHLKPFGTAASRAGKLDRIGP